MFVYDAAGNLRCVRFSNGEKIWSRNARADYRADDGYFGAGSTPIIAADSLLVNIGGDREGAGLVAFSLETGKTVWKATDEAASYSSPTRVTIDDEEFVIFVTRLNTVCIDPRNGRVRFRFPFGQRGPTVNAATPLVFDDLLFITASYGVGARLVRTTGDRVEEIWSNDNVMSSQYATCVHHDGYLFGTDGREDIGVAALRCIDVKNGSAKWSVDRFGVAHAILADDKLLILKIDGELILAEASPNKYERLANFRVFDDTCRAIPALSNGRLFVRSTTARGGELKCLQVGR